MAEMLCCRELRLDLNKDVTSSANSPRSICLLVTAIKLQDGHEKKRKEQQGRDMSKKRKGKLRPGEVGVLRWSLIVVLV